MVRVVAGVGGAAAPRMAASWWRVPVRILGGLVTGYALLAALGLSMFRLDTAGELPEVLRMDAETGVLLAAGVALLGVPPAGRGTVLRVAGVVAVALVAGAVVAGGLTHSHKEQHRARSTRPAG